MVESIKQCFIIIAMAGEAKSYYIQSIHAAKNKDFKQSKKLLKKANRIYLNLSDQQYNLNDLILKDNINEYSLLLMHTQDQAMSVEYFKILAEEINNCYKRITSLEEVIKKGIEDEKKEEIKY